MAFFVPYGGDGSASICVERPNNMFPLAYCFVGTKAAIALASLLCLDLFGFNEHFFPWLKSILYYNPLKRLVQ